MFVRELGFVQATGAGAREVFGDDGVEMPERKGLLGKDDVAVSAVCDVCEDGAVLADDALVNDESWGDGCCGHEGKLEKGGVTLAELGLPFFHEGEIAGSSFEWREVGGFGSDR